MAFNIDELQLPHRVRIQLLTPAKDAEGGNTEAASTLADHVVCLISQGSGSRDPRFSQDANVERFTVTGGNANMARTDVAFLVQIGPAAGRTFRVTGTSRHGPVDGVVDAFYRCTCEEMTS